MQHLKRILLVVSFLMTTVWVISLLRTQTIEVAPSQHVQFVIEDSPYTSPSPSPIPSVSSSTSPSPFSQAGRKTPSRSPSITPTPFAVFIPQSLHGTKERTRIEYFDTTINTPLDISIDSLRGNITGQIMSISITGQPGNGTASIDSSNTIKYTSKPWFRSYDSFKYQIMYKDDSGQLQTEEKEAHMRVRIGVMLNKPLLTIPTGYLFAETKAATTASIKAALGASAFQSLVPAKDTWLNRRYNTCAIVGNGGSLRGSKRGEEIDSHDIVVRLNLSPLRGFEEDIGTKMNITIGNGPNAVSCWKRNETDLPHNVTYEILAQLSFAPQYKNYTTCVPKYPWITYNPMSYLFIDQVDNILNEYNRVMFNGTDKKYRSTGMIAVTAMAMICDHVSVYGFERGPHMENNYYDTKYEREWSGHNYFAEKAYYTDLANGTGLFERFLEHYDLYKSFSYIVD